MRHKKVLSVLLALAMVFSAITPLSAYQFTASIEEDTLILTEAEPRPFCSITFDAVATEFGIEFATNYVKSIGLLNRFYNSLPQNRLGQPIYPENFGGIYINCEGNLVILQVWGYCESDLDIGAMVRYRQSTEIMQGIADAGVLLRQVEFPYNTLRNTFDFLDWFIPNNQECVVTSNADGISLDVINNQVIVLLASYTEDNINLFRNTVLDTPYIVFKESVVEFERNFVSYELPETYEDSFDYVDYATQQLITPSSTIVVNPGDTIRLRCQILNIVVNAGSIGYRATYLNQLVGFTTAAHISFGTHNRELRINDRVYNDRNQHIGTIRRSNLSTVDMAFFSVEPNVVAGNSVAFGRLLNNAPAWHTVGATVFIDSTRHGRGRMGVVRAPFSGELGGIWTSGMRARYNAFNGDSGAVIYNWEHPQYNGAVGIHIGGWGAGAWADGGNSLFSTVTDHQRVNVRRH